MPAVQFRIARPTHQLKRVVQFYHEGLGLEIIDSFEDHEGYDGIMLGLPSAAYHLEFTQHKDAVPVPPPSEDNLLVFYLPDLAQRDRIVSRLRDMGYQAVMPENPYWQEQGITVCDPDGWRIVLHHSRGLTGAGS
ncbi:Glyoxalase-like domain protein [compost metagenome]